MSSRNFWISAIFISIHYYRISANSFLPRKLYENFHFFRFQRRIVSEETMYGNTVFQNCLLVDVLIWIVLLHTILTWQKRAYSVSFQSQIMDAQWRIFPTKRKCFWHKISNGLQLKVWRIGTATSAHFHIILSETAKL